MSFFTYIHRRLDTGAVFYVGKGHQKRRATTRSNRNIWWRRIVEKAGFSSQIVAIWDTESEAFEHEKFLIACFHDIGASLVNLTAGGDGVTGYRFSEESKQKISAAMKARRLSAEHRRKIGEANSRRIYTDEMRENARRAKLNMSDETRRKMSESGKKKKFSEATRANMSKAQQARQQRIRTERGTEIPSCQV